MRLEIINIHTLKWMHLLVELGVASLSHKSFSCQWINVEFRTWIRARNQQSGSRNLPILLILSVGFHSTHTPYMWMSVNWFTHPFRPHHPVCHGGLSTRFELKTWKWCWISCSHLDVLNAYRETRKFKGEIWQKRLWTYQNNQSWSWFFPSSENIKSGVTEVIGQTG